MIIFFLLLVKINCLIHFIDVNFETSKGVKNGMYFKGWSQLAAASVTRDVTDETSDNNGQLCSVDSLYTYQVL